MEVYQPAEDSFLIQKHIPNCLKGMDVLDMGTGSGILAITAAKAGANVVAADCSEDVLKVAAQNAKLENVKIEFVKSDIFSNISKKFDLIICNPPYLPEDEIDERIGPSKMYSGGKTGREFIQRFVENAPKFLKPKGKILIVFSTLTGEKKVLEIFKKNKFEPKILARQKLPWEELILVEAMLST
ncbi:MAG: HemK2/MTQ2 family protein methyltransferase [Candidatus Nanoarchaeia archaeon]